MFVDRVEVDAGGCQGINPAVFAPGIEQPFAQETVAFELDQVGGGGAQFGTEFAPVQAGVWFVIDLELLQ